MRLILIALFLLRIQAIAQSYQYGPALKFASQTIPLTPVAGYFMWYNITNGVQGHFNTPPTNGETVVGWKDLGPNGYDLTNASFAINREAVYYTDTSAFFGNSQTTTNPPSGSPCLIFPSTNNCYLTNKFSTTYSQPNTFFIVMNGSQRASGIAHINGKGDQNTQIGWNAAPSNPYLAGPGGSMSGPLAETSAGDKDWRVWTFQFNGASSILRSNSVQVTLSGTTVGASSLLGIVMGNFFNLSGGAGTGIISTEFVGYNSALSSADMKTEEEYLANKYGIANVP